MMVVHPPRLATLVEKYLIVWVLLAVVTGLLLPGVAVLTRATTLLLFVMIASISLTLSVDQFRQVDGRSLGLILVGHLTMPFLAFGIARGLGLSPELQLGFVVLGAVTPELVTPVLTELAGGDTALATTALVVIGVGSVGFIPAVLALLVGDIGVPTTPIIEQLVVAVVTPMVAAVSLRAWQPDRVSAYEAYYPAISALMVILVIGGVTAANAQLIRSNLSLLLSVGTGVIVLNLVGYALGYGLSYSADPETRIATTLSVGMRDFAVAAALLIAAGLPTIASLPAVAFGVVELTTSAGLATWFDG